jgi:hypothetical protein
MNIDRLKMVVKTNSTMQGMFDHWNKRCRDTEQVKFARFKKTLINNSVKVDDNSMIRLFEILKEEGCGDFLSKNKKPYAFVWNTDLKQLASDVTGKPPTVERRKRLEKTEPRREILLVMPTENGKVFRIGLNSELTAKDLDSLSRAIKSLA